MVKPPKRMTIRTYNVGFGDCFLLSFDYGAGSERHVLIDFGSTGLPKGVPATRMMEIAQDIKQRTNGKLHAVVATHRHKDHISGFETKNGKGTGDVIRSLKPSVVVQPWTEDPDLDTKATGPTGKAKKTIKTKSTKKKAFAQKLTTMGFDSPKYVTALAHMHAIAQQMLTARNLPRAFKSELSFLGETNLANLSAVKNLMTMAPNSYVYCGKKSGLEKVLPGVTVHVLGPPTIEQTDAIKKQRASDPDQFWQFQAKAIAADEAVSEHKHILFPAYVESQDSRFPIAARWLIYHSRMTRGEQLLQIVRMLDQQMNNTSVILIFQVGSKRLLFPGDAQIENWQYALDQKKYEPLLSAVNLYKVGHHGSRNATPKGLWNLFRNRSKKRTPARLASLMSTMAGKHGSARSKTEVPRTTLTKALEQETDHFTTQHLPPQKLSSDTVVSFSRK
jgi:ribonuclease BN (tRNA processing enzyme)